MPELTKRGTTAVLQMYNDLQRIEHPTTFDAEPFSMGIDLKLSPVTVNDVMPYGVAMLIAQGDGNGDSQAYVCGLIQSKAFIRAKAHFIKNLMLYHRVGIESVSYCRPVRGYIVGRVMYAISEGWAVHGLIV